MRAPDAIPDAPVYSASIHEMENLAELLANAADLAMTHGAVRIDPPAEWDQPQLRMDPNSRFFVRMQTLPAAPFVDPAIVQDSQSTRRPRTQNKRQRRAPRKPHASSNAARTRTAKAKESEIVKSPVAQQHAKSSTGDSMQLPASTQQDSAAAIDLTTPPQLQPQPPQTQGNPFSCSPLIKPLSPKHPTSHIAQTQLEHADALLPPQNFAKPDQTDLSLDIAVPRRKPAVTPVKPPLPPTHPLRLSELRPVQGHPRSSPSPLGQKPYGDRNDAVVDAPIQRAALEAASVHHRDASRSVLGQFTSDEEPMCSQSTSVPFPNHLAETRYVAKNSGVLQPSHQLGEKAGSVDQETEFSGMAPYCPGAVGYSPQEHMLQKASPGVHSMNAQMMEKDFSRSCDRGKSGAPVECDAMKQEGIVMKADSDVMRGNNDGTASEEKSLLEPGIPARQNLFLQKLWSFPAPVRHDMPSVVAVNASDGISAENGHRSRVLSHPFVRMIGRNGDRAEKSSAISPAYLHRDGSNSKAFMPTISRQLQTNPPDNTGVLRRECQALQGPAIANVKALSFPDCRTDTSIVARQTPQPLGIAGNQGSFVGRGSDQVSGPEINGASTQLPSMANLSRSIRSASMVETLSAHPKIGMFSYVKPQGPKICTSSQSEAFLPSILVPPRQVAPPQYGHAVSSGDPPGSLQYKGGPLAEPTKVGAQEPPSAPIVGISSVHDDSKRSLGLCNMRDYQRQIQLLSKATGEIGCTASDARQASDMDCHRAPLGSCNYGVAASEVVYKDPGCPRDSSRPRPEQEESTFRQPEAEMESKNPHALASNCHVLDAVNGKKQDVAQSNAMPQTLSRALEEGNGTAVVADAIGLGTFIQGGGPSLYSRQKPREETGNFDSTVMETKDETVSLEAQTKYFGNGVSVPERNPLVGTKSEESQAQAEDTVQRVMISSVPPWNVPDVGVSNSQNQSHGIQLDAGGKLVQPPTDLDSEIVSGDAINTGHKSGDGFTALKLRLSKETARAPLRVKLCANDEAPGGIQESDEADGAHSNGTCHKKSSGNQEKSGNTKTPAGVLAKPSERALMSSNLSEGPACKSEDKVQAADTRVVNILLDDSGDHTSDPKEHSELHSKQESLPQSRPERTVNKRKIDHVSHMNFDQDEDGRLTKPIVFPDSPSPISLSAYERKARLHEQQTCSTLSGDGVSECEQNGKTIVSSPLGDVDQLEEHFWKAMSNGIGGKPITVAYGVDVEAEGAYDSAGHSYVEWYGDMAKRKKGGKRQTKPGVKKKGKRGRQRENGMGADTIIIPDRPDPSSQLGDNDREEEQKGDVKSAGNGAFPHLSPIGSRSQPKSHVGNLNGHGLLRHMPRMPGINHSMFYVGQLFTRFCWHTEDAFLNSVSYLHKGSSEKVWYAVPPRFAEDFENYASSNVFCPDLLEDSYDGQVLLMNKTTMFNPKKLRVAGVDVFRVVHKPGSFVLTAPRAYHAGFNCGFNLAEAVNFAHPTWFPVGRQASICARKVVRPLCVPWEYLLFHEAKAMHREMLPRMQQRQLTPRMGTNAGVVAKELETVIMDGEARIREYAESKNCRVSMLREAALLARNNELGPEFGPGAGMVCNVCGHTCHFYAEMCATCEHSFEARCPQHFGQGRLCGFSGHKSVLVRRHDPVLLLDILLFLESVAGTKTDAAVVLQRYQSYIRPWETPLQASGLRLRMDLRQAASHLPPRVSGENSSTPVRREKRKKPRKKRALPKVVDVESDDEPVASRKRRKTDAEVSKHEPLISKRIGKEEEIVVTDCIDVRKKAIHIS